MRDIRRIVAYYIRRMGTNDPFEIARCLNIEVMRCNLGSRAGCYMYLKKHKCIFLNDSLDDRESRLVMAHELGHAVLHPKENCYFIRNKTLLLTSKVELEANKFAAELLIPDACLEEYSYCTITQLSRILGYQEEFVKLKLK